MSRLLTPSQTVGPYHTLGMTWEPGPFVVPDGTAGAIWIRGRLVDGADDSVDDGLIETWQPDPSGRFGPDDGGFRGFGRSATDPDGRYAILTLKPGPVTGSSGSPEAPHIDVMVFARGILTRLVTRIYFGDEVAANAVDPVLLGIDDPAKRATLVAEPTADGYRFDIHLQGARETVFFRI